MGLLGRCHCFEDHFCAAITFSGNSNIDAFGDDWKLRIASVKLSEHNLFKSTTAIEANSFCWPAAFFSFLCDFWSFSQMGWRRGVIWLKWNKICWNCRRRINFSTEIIIQSMSKSSSIHRMHHEWIMFEYFVIETDEACIAWRRHKKYDVNVGPYWESATHLIVCLQREHFHVCG